MKTNCLIPTRYFVAAWLMIAGVLLAGYSARANARHGGIQNGVTMAGGAPAERDRDREYLEKRREFAKRFFGTGPDGVSSSRYMKGLVTARMLPPSPLMENRRFRPVE